MTTACAICYRPLFRSSLTSAELICECHIPNLSSMQVQISLQSQIDSLRIEIAELHRQLAKYEEI